MRKPRSILEQQDTPGYIDPPVPDEKKLLNIKTANITFPERLAKNFDYITSVNLNVKTGFNL